MLNLLAVMLAVASFTVQVHGKGPAMILIPGLASSGEVGDGAVARYQDVFTLAGFAGQPPVDPPLLPAAMEELMSTDLRPSLRRLRAPLLLIAAGAGSRFAEKDLLARSESQVAAAPQKRVLVASKARHFVMLGDPGFLFARMDEFLGGK